MSSGIDQALPRVLMARPDAERRTSRDAGAGPAFDEALGKAAKAGSERGETEPAAGERHAQRFGARFGAGYERIEDFGRKFGFLLPARGTDGEGETGAEAAAGDDAEGLLRTSARADRDHVRDAGAPPAATTETGGESAILVQQAGTGVRDTDARQRADTGETASSGDNPAEDAADYRRPDPAATRPAGTGLLGVGTKLANQDDEASDSGSSAAERASARAGGVDVRSSGAAGAAKAAAPDSDQPPEAGSPPVGAPRARQKSGGPDGSPENRPTDEANAGGGNGRNVSRVAVLAEQAIPAPAQTTSLALAISLAASGALRPETAGPAPDAAQGAAAVAPARTLSIQLHPAELGVVTASLKLAGDQLTIELQVESQEAYRALQHDTESIVKSLRGMGYDIERVTLLQPSAATPSSRSDGSTPGNGQFGGGGQQADLGASSNGGGGAGGRQPGRPDAGDSIREPSPRGNEGTGAGVYI